VLPDEPLFAHFSQSFLRQAKCRTGLTDLISEMKLATIIQSIGANGSLPVELTDTNPFKAASTNELSQPQLESHQLPHSYLTSVEPPHPVVKLEFIVPRFPSPEISPMQVYGDQMSSTRSKGQYTDTDGSLSQLIHIPRFEYSSIRHTLLQSLPMTEESRACWLSVLASPIQKHFFYKKHLLMKLPHNRL
jgi:hypothetical protein